MRPLDRPGTATGLALLLTVAAVVLVPRVGQGLTVVVQVVHDIGHWMGTQVLAPVWQFLVDLAP